MEKANVMDAQDWQMVRATALFSALSRETAERLVDAPGTRVYEKGVLLFDQGAPAEFFYLVIDGWVKVFRSSIGGDETVVSLFQRGETFAEASIFMGGHYPVSAETVTTCRLLRFSGRKLREIVREQPEVALSMLASSSQHLKMLVSQIDHMKRLTAPQRLAHFLLKLGPRAGGPCTIDLPYEKALLANRLGMTPESLSRALGKLKPLGVSVVRDSIGIADTAQLRKFAEAAGDDDDA